MSSLVWYIQPGNATMQSCCSAKANHFCQVESCRRQHHVSEPSGSSPNRRILTAVLERYYFLQWMVISNIHLYYIYSIYVYIVYISIVYIYIVIYIYSRLLYQQRWSLCCTLFRKDWKNTCRWFSQQLQCSSSRTCHQVQQTKPPQQWQHWV